jgi:hypothetical protein
MPELTRADVKEIMQRANAATKGPWIRFGVRSKLGDESCVAVGPDGCPIAYLPIGSQQKDKYHAEAFKDANFIAHARVDVTTLANAYLAALDQIEYVRDELEQWKEFWRSK